MPSTLQRCLHAAEHCFSTQFNSHICPMAVCCRTIPALIFTCVRMHTSGTRSFPCLPRTCTQAAAGFADVCECVRVRVSPIYFQHRLFSCQCADSDFSTLSYEMRDGDAGAARVPDRSYGFRVRPQSVRAQHFHLYGCMCVQRRSTMKFSGGGGEVQAV